MTITQEQLEALRQSAKQHRLTDQYSQGIYYDEEEEKGCSIGCVIHSLKAAGVLDIDYSDHKGLADFLCIPEYMTRMFDHTFELLEKKGAVLWTEQWLNAYEIDTDYSTVPLQHVAKILTRCIDYVGAGQEKWRAACRKSVIDACSIVSSGRWLTTTEAVKATKAAKAASEIGSTMWVAAWAAWAAAAAKSEVESTIWVAKLAEEAAWATAVIDAEKAWAVRLVEVQTQSNDLISLMQAAKAEIKC